MTQGLMGPQTPWSGQGFGENEPIKKSALRDAEITLHLLKECNISVHERLL